MGRVVRLWVREDGEAPKAIARSATAGPGPGKVVDVVAKSADEARDIYRRFTQPEPNRRTDPAAWLAWEQAGERVREVTA